MKTNFTEEFQEMIALALDAISEGLGINEDLIENIKECIRHGEREAVRFGILPSDVTYVYLNDGEVLPLKYRYKPHVVIENPPEFVTVLRESKGLVFNVEQRGSTLELVFGGARRVSQPKQTGVVTAGSKYVN